MIDFSAGPETRELWKKAAATIEQIEALPFLQELVAGTLDQQTFVHYLLQDDLYLADYARVMAQLSAKARKSSEGKFWARCASDTLATEELMHAAMLDDATLAATREKMAAVIASPSASPTTEGYSSWLVATASLQGYDATVAAVLPCFWIYAHIGKLLVERAGTLPAEHPYNAWIKLYDDPEFEAATQQAIAIFERCLGVVNGRKRERLEAIFLKACLYELRFWHGAYIGEDWSLPKAQ